MGSWFTPFSERLHDTAGSGRVSSNRRSTIGKGNSARHIRRIWLTLTSPAHRLDAALAAGFFPFIVADLLKLLAAAALMPGLWKITRRM